MAVLELRGLGKSFGPVHAVAGVDLRLAPGSRTAIVGPSGCGKTTLLRLIAGFETPDSGSIHLDGQLVADPAGAVPTYQRGIGLVSQDGALFPHLDIADNIGFGLPRGTRDRAARVAALCDLAGLPRGMLSRRPHELSGGQQQRVALARALAQKPRLMLLDEPFSSLDAGLRATMREAVIALLREADVASILVTHDQAEALSYADQVAVMYEGRLLQAGTPEDLYWHPRTRRTAEFLGPALILSATVAHGESSKFVGECALGAVPIDHHHRTEIAAGQRGRLMLRPEQLRLMADPEGAGTVGTVVAVGFSGATSQVALRLDPPAPGGDVLSFTLPQPSCAPLHPGDRVSIAITGHAHLLDEPPVAAE